QPKVLMKYRRIFYYPFAKLLSRRKFFETARNFPSTNQYGLRASLNLGSASRIKNYIDKNCQKA
ncbi:MAG: hypothetical protein KJ769_02610, partial [Candidatus Margulisbacteria bacterium]|nr:hypothetical protein [Candidatus Margulisiibacteriota bacterium]